MKMYIAGDLGSVYRLTDEGLEVAPINTDDTFDTDEFYPVEPNSSEEVTFLGEIRPLKEVDEIIIAALSKEAA